MSISGSDLHQTLLDAYVAGDDGVAAASVLVSGGTADILVVDHAVSFVSRSVVVADDAARIAADGLAEIGVVWSSGVG